MDVSYPLICSHCHQERKGKTGPCPHCKQKAPGNKERYVKQLAQANEMAMSYLLGAMLQRLATWPADVPKPGEPGGDLAEARKPKVPLPDLDDPADVVNTFVASKVPYLPEYAKLARLLQEHPEIYISGQIRRADHHYVHQYTTTFTLEMHDMPPEVDTEETGELANAVEKLIQEECVKINGKIYKALEREYEWLTSAESIDETIEANDWTFDEDGNIHDGELTFAQLSDEAKETARQEYRENGLDYNWWEHIYEEWTTELEEMGFDGIEISYSGFWSQGDGASFTADSFDFVKWANWHMSNKPLERGHPYTDDLPVTEAFDPDDPSMVFQQFLKTYIEDSAILKVFDYINDHQFGGSTCPSCEGTGDAIEWMQNPDLPYRECPHCDQGEVEDGSYRQVVRLWNAAGKELEQLFVRLAETEQRVTGKVSPRKDKAIRALFDYMQSPDGEYEDVTRLSDRAGSEIEWLVNRIRALDTKLSRRKPARESLDPDDPETFMLGLGQMPKHELVNTSSPPPGTSCSYACVCGQWSFGGVAATEAEKCDLAAMARAEFQQHAATSLLPRDHDALQARNFITARRLKEDVDNPPSKEHVIHMGRAGECQELCPICGAYCTLSHYTLPNGVQMPQYHICQTCDTEAAKAGVESFEETKKCSHMLGLKETDDPEIARIRKRVNKIKAEREAAELAKNPEILALDDPDTILKQEVERRSEPIKKLEVRGRRWFRRGAGGVYCKAYIYINDKLVHVTPEQYGYGDHYLTLAKDWLMRNGYLVGLLDDERDPLWTLRDKHKIDLQYGVVDVARERDL